MKVLSFFDFFFKLYVNLSIFSKKKKIFLALADKIRWGLNYLVAAGVVFPQKNFDKRNLIINFIKSWLSNWFYKIYNRLLGRLSEMCVELGEKNS